MTVTSCDDSETSVCFCSRHYVESPLRHGQGAAACADVHDSISVTAGKSMTRGYLYNHPALATTVKFDVSSGYNGAWQLLGRMDAQAIGYFRATVACM